MEAVDKVREKKDELETRIDQLVALFEGLDQAAMERFLKVANSIEEIQAELLTQFSETRTKASKPHHSLESLVASNFNSARGLVDLKKRLAMPTSLQRKGGPASWSFLIRHTAMTAESIKKSMPLVGSIRINLGTELYPDREAAQRNPSRWLCNLFHIPRNVETLPHPTPEHSVVSALNAQLPRPLSRPQGIAVHPTTGWVYIVNQGENCVHCLDSKLKYRFTFGTRGNTAGAFNNPSGIAVSLEGTVAVVDYSNDRVQLFASDGVHKMTIGKRGDGGGEFRCPYNAAFDSMGNLYVTDSNNDRVCKFDRDGVNVGFFGHRGSGAEVGSTCGIFVDDLDQVYVIGVGEKHIMVFDTDGNKLSRTDVETTGNGSLANYLTRGPNGTLALSSRTTNKVYFYTKNGVLLGERDVNQPTGIAFTDTGDFLCLQSSGDLIKL